ncbi:MAG: InlB B-repeat-containing protein, partial [Synergistaceae bacterium]|nr:InlB B-repeat-containing protein [Synergistaceae bacterium]
MKGGRDSSCACFFRCVILTAMLILVACVSFAEAVNVHDISGGGGGTVTNSWHISGGLSAGGGQLAHKITLQDGINITLSVDAYSFDAEHPQPFTHRSKVYAIPGTNISLTHTITIQEGYELAYTVDGEKISGVEFVMPDHDVVAGTENVPVVYEISYDLSGGNVVPANPLRYTVESDDFTLKRPERGGYDFAGWTGAGLTEASKDLTIPKGSTGNRKYTATWTPTVYTITYDLDGGEADNSASYTVETASFTLANPTREGYNFTGWTGTGIEGTSSSVSLPKGSTGDRTYTATFSPITYSITYNLNGGNATNPASYNIESASFTLNNPTKEGYNFTGWSGTGIEGTSSTVTIPNGSTGDRTYTATFTPITYNITYNLDGGISFGNPSSYNIESGDIRLTTPVKNGYDFMGWNYDGITSEDFTIPHNSSGDIELKALWNLHTYTISYDLHGGTSSPNNPTTYTIESEDFTLFNPEKPCYVFTGWAGSADIESSMDVNIRKGSSGDRNYFASWRPITYTISYDLKGGHISPDNPASYDIESGTFKLRKPSREGYIFMGWTGTGLTEASTDVVIPAGSSGDRFYATEWSTITFTLNYDLQGGTLTADNPSSYDVETESFTLNNPVRAAYMFIGWTGTGLHSPAMSVTIPKGSTGARSYTALWKAITYGISYTLNGANDPSNPKSYSIESGDIALKNPSRNGYAFSGWTGTGLTAKTQAVSIPKGSSGDREYTAHFTPITYAITYTLNGGKTDNPSSYTIETSSFTLNNPARAGYIFTGWTSISEGITEPRNVVSVSKGSTGNKDFTAAWSAEIYEISYDIGGGTFSGEYTVYYTTESGDIKLKTPVKKGYEFVGWSIEGEEGISEDITIPGGSMNDRKYVANWKPEIYSLTYNLDGGNASPDNPSSYTVETESFTLNNPIKAGYMFSGWTGTSLDAETITVTIPQGSTGGRNYTAHFTPIIYALSYDLNGGNSPGNPTSYTVESYDIRLSRPTRTGYDFLGWNFDGIISLDVTIPHGTIGSRKFKALWAVSVYTISYDLDGGISPGNPASYTVESNDVRLSRPTRMGYDFIGWSFDGEISLDVTIPHGSIGTREFKALWAVHVYAISYDLDGGISPGNPASYTVESNDIRLSRPTRMGYDFLGWSFEGIIS